MNSFLDNILLMIKLVLFVVINLVTVGCESSGCPAPDLIKPCVCEDNGIICGGHSDIDLVNIFQSLRIKLTKSEKHFKRFHLNNTFITELEGNTFKDITFDEITIENCNNLSKIHKNTFFETDLFTKILWIASNPALSSSDNSIFEVISKFVNLEKLYLIDNNITEIPSNAFQSIEGYQDNLKTIVFGGKSIRKIESRPFYLLHGLNFLKINNTSIDYIPENAFEFEEESSLQINLAFINNSLLNSSGFHQDSLVHFKRPVYLDLGWIGNHFEYLEEKVFKNFLNSNPHNVIDMIFVKFDCNNCKNFWLKQQPNLLENFKNLSCSNLKNFNDSENFAECGPYQSLKPCKFVKNEQAIYCGGNSDINLKEIFHKFSKGLSKTKKHFKKFYLNNNYIKVMKEYSLNDITFDEIWIKDCYNLTNIERYAFTATELVTKTLFIWNNQKLVMDNTTFDILSSFVNIESMYVNGVITKEIPSEAFRPIIGYQESLKYLTLGYGFTTIGKNAFSNLKNLESLSLFEARFNSMPDYAFEFEEYSDQNFQLRFVWGLNITSAFNEKTLLNIRRPTTLKLEQLDSVRYLTETVFLPFLLEDGRNKIELIDPKSGFDCNDCRNYWIEKNQNISNRVILTCSNQKQLNDPDNFKNCI